MATGSREAGGGLPAKDLGSLEAGARAASLLDDWTRVRHFGRYHWRLFALCCLAWSVGGSTWFTTMQFFLPEVQKEWGTPDWAVGIYGSIFYIGMAVGAPSIGRISDLRGRRPALLGAMLLTCVAAFLSALAPSAYWLLAFQLVQGIGVGGLMPLPNLLFSEWCPTFCRGYYMVLLGVGFPVAAMVATAVAWLCSSPLAHSGISGWRLLYLICAGYEAALLVVLFWLLPESPRLLLVQGRVDEARLLIARVVDSGDALLRSRAGQERLDAGEAGSARGCEAEDTRGSAGAGGPEQTLPEVPGMVLASTPGSVEASCPAGERPEGSGLALAGRSTCAARARRVQGFGVVRVLLGRRLWSTTVLLWVIWFSTNFGGQGFNIMLPQLLRSKHIQHHRVYQDVFVYSCAGVPGVLLGSFVVESHIGRRNTIFMTLLGTAAGIGLFALTSSEQQLVLFSCLFNFMINTAWVVLYTYTPEIYMTEIRSQATAAAHLWHSVSGIAAPLVGSWLVHAQVPNQLLLGFAAFVLAAVFAARLLPSETRNVDLLDWVD